MKDALKVLACTTLLATAAPTVMAEDEPFEAEIKARQSYFQVVKFNMDILGAMAKGKRDYDAALADTAAKNIQIASTMDNSAMWPQGSDKSVEALEDMTNAKPEIWSNFADFQAKQKDWKQAGDTLASSAGQGLDSLRKAVGPTGEACKACHNDYKTK